MANIITSDSYKRMKASRRAEKETERIEKELAAKRKPYKASTWARGMINQASKIQENGGRLNGAYIKELEKHGVKITKQKPKHPENFNPDKGGFA